MPGREQLSEAGPGIRAEPRGPQLCLQPASPPTPAPTPTRLHVPQPCPGDGAPSFHVEEGGADFCISQAGPCAVALTSQIYGYVRFYIKKTL